MNRYWSGAQARLRSVLKNRSGPNTGTPSGVQWNTMLARVDFGVRDRAAAVRQVGMPDVGVALGHGRDHLVAPLRACQLGDARVEHGPGIHWRLVGTLRVLEVHAARERVGIHLHALTAGEVHERARVGAHVLERSPDAEEEARRLGAEVRRVAVHLLLGAALEDQRAVDRAAVVEQVVEQRHDPGVGADRRRGVRREVEVREPAAVSRLVGEHGGFVGVLVAVVLVLRAYAVTQRWIDCTLDLGDADSREVDGVTLPRGVRRAAAGGAFDVGIVEPEPVVGIGDRCVDRARPRAR